MSAEIRHRLVDAIHTGRLAPGTPLPAERVLCHEFGVARTSVREAIQGLMIAGYVERRGNRSVVTEHWPEVSFDSEDRAGLVTRLFEVRRVLEPPIVAMAARRASDADRDEIGRIASRTPRDVAELLDTDHRLHVALARACGNPLLSELHAKALASLFGSGGFASLMVADTTPAAMNGLITTETESHRAIADAVVKGHTRKAVAAVVAHLDDVERRMMERLP